MGLTVASYNVLADSYAIPKRYPGIAADILDPGRRRKAVGERVAGLGADVVCVQEVEQAAFEAIASALGGYESRFERKGGGRPDGCAVFVRGAIGSARCLRYEDGTGHLAILVTVEMDGRPLACGRPPR
jgi:mRNA deadenylase 3'-5' endonuclease subunit Ccr4